jgi:hypothetical protein
MACDMCGHMTWNEACDLYLKLSHLTKEERETIKFALFVNGEMLNGQQAYLYLNDKYFRRSHAVE